MCVRPHVCAAACVVKVSVARVVAPAVEAMEVVARAVAAAAAALCHMTRWRESRDQVGGER